MRSSNKNIFHKLFYILLTLLLIVVLVHLFLTRPHESKTTFKHFMESYISKDVEKSNSYTLNKSLPDINLVFDSSLKQLNDESKRQIVEKLREMIFAIDYDIITSQSLLNTSTIKVRFTYYNLAKHIISYFKNDSLLQQNAEDSHQKFLDSLHSTKYKISTNIDVKLVKQNGSWNIVLSDNLLNILTAGIYKNFIT